ncbi:MAG: hypothetical protein E7463_12415 [Ruminococcaceae bacterium]|nr:hypothetical protein [Oscillospiraceae bacterium]
MTVNRDPNAIVWSFWGHEPLNHLRRMGGESIFNLGEWAEDWYDHIHTEEMVKKLAESGVNLIYTHFFKGFGLEHEREEMDNTRKLCEIARKYGIKVLGYCQLGSLYYETMFDEAPDLEDWTIYDAAGQHVCWLGEYYRWSPCFTSRGFIDYIKRVIRYGIEVVGLSGFHFDNSYNVACHCPRCTQAFRDWLTEHVKDPEKTMGIRHFRHVRIPKEDSASDTHDTLYIYWLQYKAELLEKVHEELFSYVKEVGGKDRIVLHNPCFPRATARTYARRGYDPSREVAACDYVFAENAAYIRRENGKIISQIEAFKYGERFGYRVFDTCWPHDENGTRLPKSREEIARSLLQSMIFGGVCGANWTPRTLKSGHRNVLEDTELGESLPALTDYYYRNYALFNLRPENHVKVLFSTMNCMFSQDGGLTALRDCVDGLVNGQTAFSIVVPEDIDGLEAGQTLVIPQVRYSTAAMYASLRAAAKRGVNVVFIGKFGRFNENGKERALDDEIRNPAGEGIYTCDGDAWMEKVRELNAAHQVETDAEGVIVETRCGEQGELVVHLLRADNETTLDEMTVTLAGTAIAGVEMITPDDAKMQAWDKRSVTIANFKTTATLIVKRNG